MPAALAHELTRKAIHLTSAVVPLAYAAGVARGVVLGALGMAGALAATIEIARQRSPRVRDAFDRAVGRLLRAHERGRWSGATWMCAAYGLAVLVFPRREAVAAMLAVAFGDASAAVVGRLVSRRVERRRADRGVAARTAPAGPVLDAPTPAGGGAKTWAGSIACWGATTVGALCVARTGVAAALVCGLAAALAERPRWVVDDNVRVALAAGAAAWAVGIWDAAL